MLWGTQLKAGHPALCPGRAPGPSRGGTMWGIAAGQDGRRSLPRGKPHSGSRARCVPKPWPSTGSHPLLRAQAMVLGDGGGQGLAVPDSPLLLAGTRIIYDRKFLLECKNSPVARTPPCCLPQIPGVTSLAQSSLVKLEELKERNESEEAMPDQDQFEMDI
ncbi:eukaryotic translation initiation factor 4E-binding protein 3 isoform X1 [Gavia stellata]|uniref:eukaryotic translation initiation factor 4E-binding protein 3 isoform X1 n=1 Tax=Gavia stellata TaxID=37040 RepID=UPI0028A1DDB8|nr:eukaryotic translation initiation factor 4E-binding protein 3 isoform X1 [Gavia stellata]